MPHALEPLTWWPEAGMTALEPSLLRAARIPGEAEDAQRSCLLSIAVRAESGRGWASELAGASRKMSLILHIRQRS